MLMNATVYIVDDNESVRKALKVLIQSVGLAVEAFAFAADFLDTYNSAMPGCLVLDVRMQGMSGLELQQKLVERGVDIPVIIITGHGDVSMAVRAMKAGAVDFIEKPFNDQVLLDRINQAIDHDIKRHRERQRHAEIMGRLERLSAREREVLDLLIAGKPNKVIAHDLGVSYKTIEAHRANLMEKMQARSVVELTRMVLVPATAKPIPWLS